MYMRTPSFPFPFRVGIAAARCCPAPIHTLPWPLASEGASRRFVMLMGACLCLHLPHSLLEPLGDRQATFY